MWIVQERKAAQQDLLEAVVAAGGLVFPLPWPNQLHYMFVSPAAFDNPRNRRGASVDFRWISLSNHGDAQRRTRRRKFLHFDRAVCIETNDRLVPEVDSHSMTCRPFKRGVPDDAR